MTIFGKGYSLEIKDKAITMNPYEFQQTTIEIGGQQVIINKLFGPMVFMDLRISPDHKDCCWIIERYTIFYKTDGSDDSRWVEWCRIPGQFEWEFFQKNEE